MHAEHHSLRADRKRLRARAAQIVAVRGREDSGAAFGAIAAPEDEVWDDVSPIEED